MKSGRRIADPAKKKLANTYRADRHGAIVELVPVVKSSPVAPSYMTAEGRAVWDEELQRVITAGATEADSSMFARHCELEAAFRTMILAGETPKSSLVTELRRSSELLGIAGHRSRLAKVSPDAQKPASPFSVRPA